MNIFATHIEPSQCALEHCNTHVNKMLVEYAQLMSMAHDHWGTWHDGMYRTNKSHMKHPSTLWCAKSKDNYRWLYDVWFNLADMYWRRTNKEHASWYKLGEHLRIGGLEYNLPQFNLTMLAVGDNITSNNVFLCYQRYLTDKFDAWRTRTDKKKIIPVWLDNNIPDWYTRNSEAVS